MKWKLTISFFILLTLLPFITRAATSTELQSQIDQVKKDREALVEEQKRLQAELDSINKETRNLGAAVKSLDTTKQKLAADIKVTQSKIKSTDLTIQSLEGTIGEKESQIVVHQKAIANTLHALSEHDTRPLILSMLASAGLSGMWQDRSQLEGLNTKLEDEINALRETRKVLSLEKVAKQKVKDEQVSLQGQLSGQKSVVEENQKAKEQLLAQTKNKEAEYQKLLQQNLAAQQQFENDLSRLEEQLRITLDPSLLPTKRHSVLSWPLDNIFVTDRFGQVEGRWHNGLDLRASMGTPVKAVLSGIISGAGNTDERNAEYKKQGKKACISYGRWILIKHDNGLSSVYAHLSGSLVKAGQYVETGDIIGYSGGAYGVNGSGYSFGAHLHVGLLATQGVEIRQLTNSKGGCQETYMPIAKGVDAYLDPLDYLPSL